jgi:hypothetical protein
MYKFVSKYEGDNIKTKKLFTANDNDFYKKNFIRDIDSGLGAIKTNKTRIPVSKCKITALIRGVRRYGLKGIKGDPSRSLRGAAMLSIGPTLIYKGMHDK